MTVIEIKARTPKMHPKRASATDIVVNFADEQYTTINQSIPVHFDPRVFVNCLQVEKCCKRRLFIWLQSGHVTNACVNKVTQ